MLKLMKMRTKDGKWIIEDQDRVVTFDSSYDAWMYVFLMKEIRPKLPAQPRSLYPVLSLNPTPIRIRKKVMLEVVQ